MSTPFIGDTVYLRNGDEPEAMAIRACAVLNVAKYRGDRMVLIVRPEPHIPRLPAIVGIINRWQGEALDFSRKSPLWTNVISIFHPNPETLEEIPPGVSIAIEMIGSEITQGRIDPI